jgi:hypothetical protein
MRQVQPITLLKGDGVASNTDYRDLLPCNVSGVVRPILGAAGYMLQQPGLTQYGTAVGADRGGIWNERLQMLFRVSGTSLVSVSASGAVTVLGTVPGTGPVSLPYSFNTQAIIADGRYFLYDPVNGFREVTGSAVGNPLDGVWVDGYYFFTDGEFIYHTDLADESVIDPLKYATSEFSPDPSLGVGLSTDNKVIVFNRYTTEYFDNRATENFAFQRLTSRSIKYGIVGPHAKCEIGGSWFILGGEKGSDVSLFLTTVGSAHELASREVVKILNQYNEDELFDAVIEGRVVDQIRYIIVYLPNETLMLNLQVAQAAGPDQAWSILKTDVTGNDAWRGRYGVFDPRSSRWTYGDRLSGALGFLDNDSALHFGDIAECIVYTPFVYLENMSVDELDIETIPGFTATSDATVFVSMTYNGLTWGQEYTMQYGLPGEYGKRFIAYRFGYVRNWFAFKLRWASRSRMAFGLGKIYYG